MDWQITKNTVMKLSSDINWRKSEMHCKCYRLTTMFYYVTISLTLSIFFTDKWFLHKSKLQNIVFCWQYVFWLKCFSWHVFFQFLKNLCSRNRDWQMAKKRYIILHLCLFIFVYYIIDLLFINHRYNLRMFISAVFLINPLLWFFFFFF